MKKSLPLIMCCIFGSMCAESKTGSFNATHTGSGLEDIRSNLYVKQGTGAPVLLDGDLTEYDPSFSNSLNAMDARKMSNFSENLGMIRSNYVLVVERRQTINLTDTIFYKIWQMQQQRPYQLEFITTNLDHPDMEGYLEDSYLKTATPIDLNGKTIVDFTINSDLASAAVDRFRIIFKTAIAASPLPLTFTSLKAYKQHQDIRVDWRTENETNIKEYQVEKSIDGNHFSLAGDVKANNFALNNYSWVDEYPANGYNYYRLLNKEKDGKDQYSAILKVFNGKENAEINLYPNPVTDNILHVQITNQLPGLYEIRLFNNTGQLVWGKKIQHSGGDIRQTIEPNQSMKKGVYRLDVVTPRNNKITENVFY